VLTRCWAPQTFVDSVIVAGGICDREAAVVACSYLTCCQLAEKLAEEICIAQLLTSLTVLRSYGGIGKQQVRCRCYLLGLADSRVTGERVALFSY